MATPETTTTSSLTLQRRRQSRKLLRTVLIYSVLVLVSLGVLAPLLLTVSGSFKTNADILKWPPSIIPNPWVWDNYARVWNSSPLFVRWLLNSVFISGTTVVVNLFTVSLAGYAFARMRFPGKNVIFLALLGTLMIPIQLTLVPNYILMNRLGWLNTYLALFVPWSVSVFGVFLTTQFMKALPVELEEAAFIDGASRWQLYWRVVLPLSKPVLAALAIFRFKDTWNDFLIPLIYMNTPDMFPLTVGLNYFRNEYYTLWNLVLTGAMFNIIPMAIIFLIFQKYFVKGIATSGLKG